ncbi:MAG: BatA domain-containing protein [Bacteroidetes bacterium]|nr:BatA domain-containing protein [Bacteroidota bacterium]
MQFVYPFFLFGLFALAIPVLIHLFNLRRYRRVYFSNVRYLKMIRQETRKQSQLRHLLVLIARMLAIASIVMAFAQPYIPSGDDVRIKQGSNAISIYVDNSFSMQASSDAGSLLDNALRKASEIAMAYNATDEFSLITNDFAPASNRFYTRQDFLDVLDDISFAPVFRSFNDILQRQQEILKSSGSGNLNAFLVSDFQLGMLETKTLAPDSNINVFVVPLFAKKSQNVYIDSCWFESPALQVNQPLNLMVSLVNGSDNKLEKIPLKLEVDGIQRALASFDVESGEHTLVRMTFSVNTPGWKKGLLRITDYPVIYDDELFFGFMVNDHVSVYSINGDEPGDHFRNLFGEDSLFLFRETDAGNVDYSGMGEYNLIILNGVQTIGSGMAVELNRILEQNRSLLIIPSEKVDRESYNEFLKPIALLAADTALLPLGWLNLNAPLFEDVFEESPLFEGNSRLEMPIIKHHFPLDMPATSNTEVLMKMFNDDPFLVQIPAGKGNVFLFTAPVSERGGDFYRHALFVPVMLRMAMMSFIGYGDYDVINRDELIFTPFSIPPGRENIHLKNVDNGFDVIPETGFAQRRPYLNLHGNISEAGHYDLYSGNSVLGSIALNYDRRESQLGQPGEDDLMERLNSGVDSDFKLLSDQNKPLSVAIRDMNEGKRLWKLFIIFALVFLASEVLMLRFWK